MSKWLEKEKERWKRAKAKRQQEKKEYREAYEKARRRGKIARASREGFRAGNTSALDKMSRMLGSPPPKRSSRPRMGTTSKRRKRPSMGTTRRRKNPPNIMGDFDII